MATQPIGLRRRWLDAYEEIKAAYRTAMLKNHPDKVAHLDPVLQELAAKRSQDIIAAVSSLYS